LPETFTLRFLTFAAFDTIDTLSFTDFDTPPSEYVIVSGFSPVLEVSILEASLVKSVTSFICPFA